MITSLIGKSPTSLTRCRAPMISTNRRLMNCDDGVAKSSQIGIGFWSEAGVTADFRIGDHSRLLIERPCLVGPRRTVSADDGDPSNGREDALPESSSGMAVMASAYTSLVSTYFP